MLALKTIIIAFVFNFVDLISGLTAGIKEHDINSSKLRDGLFKKVGFIFCYFLGWLIDTYGALIGFETGIEILPVIVFFACTTELVSILENIGRINPDLKTSKLFEIFRLKKD